MSSLNEDILKLKVGSAAPSENKNTLANLKAGSIERQISKTNNESDSSNLVGSEKEDLEKSETEAENVHKLGLASRFEDPI